MSGIPPSASAAPPAVGQFIASTCNAAGLRLRILLRNTRRDANDTGAQGVVHAGLRVFKNNALIWDRPDFARVPVGGVVEFSGKDLPALDADDGECLVVARIGRDGEAAYFPQEHQMILENGRGAYTSLIYDQIPIPKKAGTPSPIVLLAPKTWVGRDVDTRIAFCNASDPATCAPQARPMDVTFLSEDGAVVHRASHTLTSNSAFVLDVRRALAGRFPVDGERRFVNVVARGGASHYAIFTVVTDRLSGHSALEHSLSPHYYVSGSLARVREEALLFQ